MNSREHILSKIKAIPRDEKPLPKIPDFSFEGDLAEKFTQSIQFNKGEIVGAGDLAGIIAQNKFKKILSLVSSFEALANTELPADSHQLKDLDLAIIEGQFGVAENAAIWLTDENMGLRALPFITEHLVIVLKKNSLVTNMHEAYKKISLAHSGFGLFIAGPSKTADIEQSLVIGAHGAKSLRVVLM
ncbi:MAG: L-lactate dehydrogenase [Mongoliibacter sp.]|uniref:LutC/YkgG family protein n=1 Tax=Mongoliibacter sp. TaxID=2022438 RepID=UPI0012EFCDA8|nr:LUD domain-containing protein [Mongoliibacter sp.]TVP46236.1 MAG: L-lactate dehydrogenase [Mongoliibacter sp.]